MKKLILCAVCLPLLAHANEDRLTVGALASFGSNAYAVDDKVGAVPLVLYNGDYTYAEGSEMGFYAYKDHEDWFRAGISYEGRSFDPEKAKTAPPKGLNNRKASANIVLSYMRITPVGGFEIKAGTDMMDRSGGQTISLAHRSRFKLMDDKLTVYPKIGANWYSDDYNQYYFGVSADESTKTGIPTYQARAGVSPFVSISGRYQFTNHLGAFANAKAEWLSSTQKDSPLTDDNMDIGANLGVTYTF